MIVLARVRQRSLIAFCDFPVISISSRDRTPEPSLLSTISLEIWKITQICRCIDACVGCLVFHAESD